MTDTRQRERSARWRDGKKGRLRCPFLVSPALAGGQRHRAGKNSDDNRKIWIGSRSSGSIAKWVTTSLSERPASNERNWPDGDIAIGHRYDRCEGQTVRPSNHIGFGEDCACRKTPSKRGSCYFDDQGKQRWFLGAL